jgi:hypothetical protein
VAWYHEYLAHTCKKCVEDTITEWLMWPGLSMKWAPSIELADNAKYESINVRNTDIYQQKRLNLSLGEHCHVDLVGPFTIQTPTKSACYLNWRVLAQARDGLR